MHIHTGTVYMHAHIHACILYIIQQAFNMHIYIYIYIYLHDVYLYSCIHTPVAFPHMTLYVART